MFSFKIRAWMENIVRNKKSKSKSKHSTHSSGNAMIMVGSPNLMRRSEISPLQNLNGGREGWKTPDSPGHGPIIDGSSHSRYKYPSADTKKVIIEARTHPKRNVSEEKEKHYSSGASDFGSVMNYISSPESAYSTLHSDECLSPASSGATHNPCQIPSANPTHGRLLSTENNFANVNHTAPLFESPSPRQRSRIRTNPWYKTQANLLPTNNAYAGSVFFSKQSSPCRSQSNCSSPSRVKINGCDIGVRSFGNCEVLSPNSVRKRKLVEFEQRRSSSSSKESLNVEGEEDDDSTLKEIMGKFDEISYTYDKETDILSDSSDHTHCQGPSSADEYDGQEAEDEYEEEIDYIDTHAVSISESIKYKNSGSCEYYMDSSRQTAHQISRASLKLRKRIRRTRKKSECSTTGSENGQLPNNHDRACRSVGGTPILNRRSAKPNIKKENDTTYRCNSLTTLSSPQKTLITIAESEKQLLKSDLEAFIMYRELITEAETILGCMKPADYKSVANTTRHLPNKRVEMLRAEVSKRSEVQPNHGHNSGPLKPTTAHKLPLSCHHGLQKPHSPLPVHRKIELLKQEQYAFGPPVPSKSTAKENQPPPQYYSPKPVPRAQVIAAYCPKSEPLRRKVYGSPVGEKHLKQEMILKTLQDLKRSLEDQTTQLYSLNENP